VQRYVWADIASSLRTVVVYRWYLRGIEYRHSAVVCRVHICRGKQLNKITVSILSIDFFIHHTFVHHITLVLTTYLNNIRTHKHDNIIRNRVWHLNALLLTAPLTTDLPETQNKIPHQCITNSRQWTAGKHTEDFWSNLNYVLIYKLHSSITKIN